MAEERRKGVEAEREPNFLLAKLERRFLPWAAGKLPRWILPDDLTALGVLAAFGVCGAYQLSNHGRGWLWAASALLVVQWVGDSLDFRLLELNLTVFDVIGLGILVAMLALLTVRVFGNLRELAKEEPSARRS